MITLDTGSSTLSRLLGNGVGGFTPADPVDVGAMPTALELADLDDDGALDLLVAHDAELQVFLSNP